MRATCTDSRFTPWRTSASRRLRWRKPRCQGSIRGARRDARDPLTADNALALVREHDVVVDCSDNFLTKFLINDAAVLAQRPAFSRASTSTRVSCRSTSRRRPMPVCGACGPRQRWMESSVIARCRVLGRSRGVRRVGGALDAQDSVEPSGRLEGELLLLDFASSTPRSSKRPADRIVQRRAARSSELKREEPDIEVRMASLTAAREQHFELIDVRTAEEFAAQPTEARHVPMTSLLADPKLLEFGPHYLLVCASGKRSLAAARELRKRGLDARSLAGGLQSLAGKACAFRANCRMWVLRSSRSCRAARSRKAHSMSGRVSGLSDRCTARAALVEAVAEGTTSTRRWKVLPRCASTLPESSRQATPSRSTRLRRSPSLARYRGVVRCNSSRHRPGR